jgi:hypothetical protein
VHSDVKRHSRAEGLEPRAVEFEMQLEGNQEDARSGGFIIVNERADMRVSTSYTATESNAYNVFLFI